MARRKGRASRATPLRKKSSQTRVLPLTSQLPSASWVTSQWRLMVRQPWGSWLSRTRTVATTCSMMSSWPSRTRAAMKPGATPMRWVLR